MLMPLLSRTARAPSLPGLFSHPPVAFRYLILGQLQTASRFFRLRLPVFPPCGTLLKQEHSPFVMLIGEQHAAVNIVEIRGRFHGGQSGAGNREHLTFERLSLFNQRRRVIGFALRERSARGMSGGRQLRDGLFLYPGFRCHVGRRRGRRLRTASRQ